LRRFEQGDVVAVREIWRGRVWKARPWIVVHDRSDQLALYIPRGARVKVPPGSGIPRDDWVLKEDIWTRDTLRLTTPGEPHSVLLWWEDGFFEGWYVNLERPLVRSPVGFDYLDHELDILVRPDRSWEFLDEGEFEEAQALGVIEPEEAVAVRAEAERVVARIEEWTAPFCDGWEHWQPERTWEAPSLPRGWDVVLT
jgi:Protein of unknown function (DUF402)